MNRDDFSYKVDIHRNGKFYKTFNIPWTDCADQVFADLIGHLSRTETMVKFDSVYASSEVTDTQVSYID